MYTAFAQVYDELMQDVNYPAWADFYGQVMAYHGIKGGRVAECACGTGSLTLPLYHMGLQITGVDISQDMLWQAAQKARKDGAAIPFVKQDMRDLRLHRPMDAVLATCDGVNYLTKDEDALAFFQSAYQALRPGGGLFFDVSTPYKLENLLGDQLLSEDTPGITYIWQNYYSPKTKLCQMDLCIFVKQGDGSYQRMDENQVQRAYDQEELKTLLYRAGFQKVFCYGDGHMGMPSPKEQRWHIAAIRAVDPEMLPY